MSSKARVFEDSDSDDDEVGSDVKTSSIPAIGTSSTTNTGDKTNIQGFFKE